MLKTTLIASMIAFTSIAAHADETVVSRHITDLGCHNVNGTCYVTLDGPAFGSTLGCTSGATNEFRFDNGDTPIGLRAYSSFVTAWRLGKVVTVYLSGCTSQGAPALTYFHLS